MREGTLLADPASAEHHETSGGCEICPRLRSALLAALADTDLQGLDAGTVAARAGLSEDVFAEHYGSLEECVLDAFDRLADELHGRFEQAFDGSADWHARLALGLTDAFDGMLDRPGATRLLLLEAPRACDPRLQEHRVAARDRLVSAVTAPWEQEAGPDVPGLHVEFLVGALERAGHDELAASGDFRRAVGRVRELLTLFEPLPA